MRGAFQICTVTKPKQTGRVPVGGQEDVIHMYTSRDQDESHDTSHRYCHITRQNAYRTSHKGAKYHNGTETKRNGTERNGTNGSPKARRTRQSITPFPDFATESAGMCHSS